MNIEINIEQKQSNLRLTKEAWRRYYDIRRLNFRKYVFLAVSSNITFKGKRSLHYSAELLNYTFMRQVISSS